MNRRRIVCLTLGLALAGCQSRTLAQTPADHPAGGFQPLSLTGVRVFIGCGRPVAANVVGQFPTRAGERYLVDTRRGRTVVDGWALIGLRSAPQDPVGPQNLPTNVHKMH